MFKEFLLPFRIKWQKAAVMRKLWITLINKKSAKIERASEETEAWRMCCN
jgi:hypothetical protein